MVAREEGFLLLVIRYLQVYTGSRRGGGGVIGNAHSTCCKAIKLKSTMLWISNNGRVSVPESVIGQCAIAS